MEDRKVLADKYEVLSEIKKGGFGTVYFGYDLHLRKPVAIKKVNSSLLQEAQYIDMFQTEARNVAKLNHRNIVHIYDFQRTFDDQVYIIMEYIDGGDLGKALRKCREIDLRLPMDLAVYIIGEICKALDFAFNRTDPETNKPLQLVHQDICPSNIMLSSQGVVKLIDFGIAGIRYSQILDDRNSIIVAGKLPYMSPEQFESDFVPTQSSDLFSLGSVLYEILMGQRAFPQSQADELIESVRKAKIDSEALRQEGIPVEIQKLILRGMQKNPEKRYLTANEMYQDINSYLTRNNGNLDLSSKLAGWVQQLFSDTKDESEKTPMQDEKLSETMMTSVEYDITSSIDMDSFYESQLEEDYEKIEQDIEPKSELEKIGEQPDDKEMATIDEVTPIDLASEEIIPEESQFEIRTERITETEEESEEEELKTIIDVVRLSARTHKKKIIGSLIAIVATFIAFTALDTALRWTYWGTSIYDFFFPPAIKIVTIPADAVIYLDDEKLNSKSPVSIPRISPGVHKLTLSLSGYPDVIRSIQVPSKGVLSVVGERSPNAREPYLFRFQSSIDIVSNPTGATIFLNNVQYTEVTPCQVSWDVGIPVSIIMEKPGFERLTGFSLNLLDEVEQIEDRRIWQFSTLTDIYRHYSVEGTFRKHIKINSIPVGAEIFVDNEANPIGLTGYQSDVLLTVGRHELVLRREGFIPRQITVYVDEEGPNEINEVLYRTVRFFAKSVSDQADNEIGAMITQLISKDQVTIRNDITPCEIALGPYPYEVLVQKEGFKDAVIQVSPGTNVVVARLEPEFIQVLIEVIDALSGMPLSNAQVSYKNLQEPLSEDTFFAMTGPDGRCMGKIEPGQYTFKVKKFGYQETVKTLSNNGTNTLSFRLVLL